MGAVVAVGAMVPLRRARMVAMTMGAVVVAVRAVLLGVMVVAAGRVRLVLGMVAVPVVAVPVVTVPAAVTVVLIR